MNPDKLLDAIGMVDDKYLAEGKNASVHTFRRKLVALAAAVLIIVLSLGTAMAVSPEFRELIFSIFRIESKEEIPDIPTEDTLEGSTPIQGLEEFAVALIDDQVTAHYFLREGMVRTYEGGFYTSSWTESGIPGEDGTFWEIRKAGIEPAETKRVDFPLLSGEKQLQITFDYAILQGKLCLNLWARDLDKDPEGYGWNVTPIGSRLDVVLLEVPLLEGDRYTHNYYLLNLETREMTDVLTDFSREGTVIHAIWYTSDLRYVLLSGEDRKTEAWQYWLFDREEKTVITLAEVFGADRLDAYFLDAYFLDDSTLLCRLPGEDDRFDLVKYHIPTKTITVILEDTAPYQGGQPGYQGIHQQGRGGTHGILMDEGGTASILDLQTLNVRKLSGLETAGMVTSESPDGRKIFLGHRTPNEGEDSGWRFSDIGVLDLDTGVLKQLSRELSGNAELFWGWLDDHTITLIARDAAGGYYVYVYDFQGRSPEAAVPPEETAPPETETAGEELAADTFVRVREYIPAFFTELPYATEDNFTGQVIYDFNEPWLRYGTVQKLQRVCEELAEQGLYIKIWDAFRPLSAQYKLWEVYPDPAYVSNPATGSNSHCRGNTVDITLVHADGTELNMPTGFDDFSPLADRDYSDCPPDAAENAILLQEVMEKHGFKPYQGEWWHFTDTQDYPVEESFIPAEPAWYYADCREYINLRAEPSGEASVVIHIPAGEQFMVFAWHGDFALVNYHGLQGYVNKYYIQER